MEKCLACRTEDEEISCLCHSLPMIENKYTGCRRRPHWHKGGVKILLEIATLCHEIFRIVRRRASHVRGMSLSSRSGGCGGRCSSEVVVGTGDPQISSFHVPKPKMVVVRVMGHSHVMMGRAHLVMGQGIHGSHLVLLFPLHATILKPNLDLSFRQTECMGNLDASSAREVTIEMELFFQLQSLVSCVRCSLAFCLSICVHSTWRQKNECLVSFVCLVLISGKNRKILP